MRVVLATPRGFCAGVERAIETVERALERYGAPVYVRHEIVHNRRVVDALAEKGAIFVEDIDQVPLRAVCIFSAHGVSRKIEDGAANRGLQVIDATCPLVTKVHKEGRRYATKGYQVILIGHRDHVEVHGTLGQIPAEVHVVADAAEVKALDIPDDAAVAYVSQTTLAVMDTAETVAAIKSRWPGAVGQNTRDICYATQNRQQAVIDMAGEVDLFIVAGAQNSSNSTRLREIADRAGVPAYLINGAEALDPAWLDGVRAIGVTAGASAPEIVVQEIIARLASLVDIVLETRGGAREEVVFRLPRGLDDAGNALRAAG
ncbi:MAG: 4-hydroxy-3-methylbut-2-enyl diphosphate reductase [Pseudomonadota bacterium]